MKLNEIDDIDKFYNNLVGYSKPDFYIDILKNVIGQDDVSKICREIEQQLKQVGFYEAPISQANVRTAGIESFYLENDDIIVETSCYYSQLHKIAITTITVRQITTDVFIKELFRIELNDRNIVVMLPDKVVTVIKIK